MDTLEIFLDFATKCVDLARRAETDEDRQDLAAMAAGWLALAKTEDEEDAPFDAAGIIRTRLALHPRRLH